MRDAASRSLNRTDLALAIVLALLALGYVLPYALQARSSIHPHEDAAILMRYSEHLADGHGIVWNVGEKPVDGATDFLFMVLVAALARVGLHLEDSVLLLVVVAHVLTVMLVYLANRRFGEIRSRWLPLVAAAFLLTGPGNMYVRAYFGTTVFALSASVVWYLAVGLMYGRPSTRRALAFAISCLVMGLIRPEGVLLSLFVLVAVWCVRGFRESKAVTVCFLVVMAVAGGFYFVWRWRYFGYPLPNPYYKKGGMTLHPRSLLSSALNLLGMLNVFVIPLLLSLRSRAALRRTLPVLVPLIGFAGIWILLSSEMNWLMRFQYPVVPLVLMSSSLLLGGLSPDFPLPRRQGPGGGRRAAVSLLLGLAAVGVFFYYQRALYDPRKIRGSASGLYDVAMVLRDYEDEGYTIAVSEAGLLPLYSKWRALDTWGLNDQWIAHNGRITEEYLGTYDPEIIMFHAWYSPVAGQNAMGTAWSDMVLTLDSYARRHGYILAASYGGNPGNAHYYYVKPGFSRTQELVERIRSTPYSWDGIACVNYAAPSGASVPDTQ